MRELLRRPWVATEAPPRAFGPPALPRIPARPPARARRCRPATSWSACSSPHTDIIVKRRRDIQFGHKLNLTTGRSGLILDLVIEAGNPVDSERLLPMLERHITFYGTAPRQAAADGGYASRANLRQAKAWGVGDMAFQKSGLRIEDMAKSRWVYRKLRNFRAGWHLMRRGQPERQAFQPCLCACRNASRRDRPNNAESISTLV
jgi:IS5 family transposase